jgi:hypothetical protein
VTRTVSPGFNRRPNSPNGVATSWAIARGEASITSETATTAVGASRGRAIIASGSMVDVGRIVVRIRRVRRWPNERESKRRCRRNRKVERHAHD